jgi:hypothetical protein
MTGASVLQAAVAFAMLVTALVVTPVLADDDIVQETQMLRVTIAGKTVRLEAVIVKRADAAGRLPVAFMNHGRPNANVQSLMESLTNDDPALE